MEKINIAEILKDCPKGTKLYSPLCGECYFDSLNMGTIICKKQNTQEITFTSEGYYMLPVFDDCECVLFPSKECRDWSKFQIPFKDGDILVSGLGDCGNPFIFKQINGWGNAQCYCAINVFEELTLDSDNWTPIKDCRLATKEEKEKLFDAIKAEGYHWNEENKILEKLVKPNFKAGNKIEKCGYRFTIAEVKDNYYLTKCGNKISFDYQDDFSLVPNKFDITTLKPFDKVLVRNDNTCWRIEFFERINKKNKNYPFVCMYGHNYKQCIPYEGNEHLLGKTDDCSEFYKTW